MSGRTIFLILITVASLCGVVVHAVRGDNVIIRGEPTKRNGGGGGGNIDFLTDTAIEFHVEGVGGRNHKNNRYNDSNDDPAEPGFYGAGGGGNKNKGRKSGKYKGSGGGGGGGGGKPKGDGKSKDEPAEYSEDSEDEEYAEDSYDKEYSDDKKGGGEKKNKTKGNKKDKGYDDGYDDDKSEDSEDSMGGGSGSSGGNAQSERRRLPDFSFRYTYTSNEDPDNTDYNELSEVTTAFLDAYMDEVFLLEPAIHAFTTVETYRVLQKDLVEYEVSSHFFLPGLVPRVTFLNEQFQECFTSGATCLRLYINELAKMDSSNPFSSTTSVELVESEVGNKIEGGPLQPIAKPKVQRGSITKVLISILVTVGSVVLFAVLYLWVYRKKPRHQGKSLGRGGGLPRRFRSNQVNDDGTFPSDSPIISAYYGGDEESPSYSDSPRRPERNQQHEKINPDDLEDVSLNDPRVGGIGNIRMSKVREAALNTTKKARFLASGAKHSLILPSLQENVNSEDSESEDEDENSVESAVSQESSIDESGGVSDEEINQECQELDCNGDNPDNVEDPLLDLNDYTSDIPEASSEEIESGHDDSSSENSEKSEPVTIDEDETSKVPPSKNDQETPAAAPTPAKRSVLDMARSLDRLSEAWNDPTSQQKSPDATTKKVDADQGETKPGIHDAVLSTKSTESKPTKLDSSSLAMGIIGDTFFNYLHMDEAESDEEDLREDV